VIVIISLSLFWSILVLIRLLCVFGIGRINLPGLEMGVFNGGFYAFSSRKNGAASSR